MVKAQAGDQLRLPPFLERKVRMFHDVIRMLFVIDGRDGPAGVAEDDRYEEIVAPSLVQAMQIPRGVEEDLRIANELPEVLFLATELSGALEERREIGAATVFRFRT